LTEDTVKWALDRYFIDRWTQRRIANATGVCLGTIGRIVRGETWVNIKRPTPKTVPDTIPLPPEVIEKFRPSPNAAADAVEEFLRKRKGAR
jgi:hypothetical protein